jgi:hypothetical protein
MEYLKHPKIEAKLLWHCNYWDGPINGIAEYQNHKYWFQQCDDFLNYPEMVAQFEDFDETLDWFRRYTVHELTPEELTEEVYCHDSFRNYVGTHTDYNENEDRKGVVHDKVNHSKFFDKSKDRKPLDYTQNKIMGWFEK